MKCEKKKSQNGGTEGNAKIAMQERGHRRVALKERKRRGKKIKISEKDAKR